MKLPPLLCLPLLLSCLDLPPEGPTPDVSTPEPEGQLLDPEPPPDCAPHRQVLDDGATPLVKLAFAIDASGSLQFTDGGGFRTARFREAVSSWAAVEDLFVATFTVGSVPQVDPDPLTGASFVPVGQWVEPGFLSRADSFTDLEGTLRAIRRHIEVDIANTSDDERARTIYAVRVFTDGTPGPRCCIAADETVGAVEDATGCPVEELLVEPDARTCDGHVETQLCNEVDWLANVRDNAGVGPDYGDGPLEFAQELEVGGDYNRIASLTGVVEEIRALGAQHGVASIDVGFSFLDASAYLDEGVQQIQSIAPCRSKAMLQALAIAGGGPYVQYTDPSQIDFISFYEECALEE